MVRVGRVAGRAAVALATCALLAGASLLLALAAVGVFATSGPAWTFDIAVAGTRWRLNVIGLVRLATLPGVTRLLGGHAVATPAGKLRFTHEADRLRVRCTPCRVRHPELATQALTLRSVTLDVRRSGDLVEGTLTVDALQVPFSGRLQAAAIELAWQLPPTELQSIYRALGDAVPEAATARIEGTVQAAGTLTLPSRHVRLHWSAERLEVGGLGTEVLQYGWFRFSCAQRDGRRTVTGDGERGWIALDAAGPYLAAAVLAAEDQRFHQHMGFDDEALAAILADVEDGRPTRGGSTITQQLARTLFTGGEHTVARKLRELLYALEMERTLGKARILELYLNTVDWGPGVCGARAAARAYFNKTPARLSALEAAWLAGILRNPQLAWAQQRETGQADRDRATQVLMQMREWPKRERRRFAAQPLAFAPPLRPQRATAGASPGLNATRQAAR